MEKPAQPMPRPQPQPQPLPQPPQMPEYPMPMPEHHPMPMPCMPSMHPCDPRLLRHMYHQLKACHKYELEMLRRYMKYCESTQGCHHPRRCRPRGRNPHYSPWESSSSRRHRWESSHNSW